MRDRFSRQVGFDDRANRVETSVVGDVEVARGSKVAWFFGERVANIPGR